MKKKYYSTVMFSGMLLASSLALADRNPGVSLTDCHTATALPSPHCGVTPTPAFDRQGRLWVAFVQHGHVYVAHSDDAGATFSSPVAVNPAVEEIYTNGENRPKIAFGPKGEIYLSWTQKTAGRYTGNIRFSRSLNGGAGFDAPRTVNDDGLPVSHRFDSLLVTASGRIYLVWLDKRDNSAVERDLGRDYKGAALYYTVSQDRGEHFAPNRKLADHSCECCRLGMAQWGEDGFAMFWRHIFDANTRDHAFMIFDPAAKPAVQRVTFDDWRIDACPHHGPAISRAGGHGYHLAWFTNGPERKGVFYGYYHLDEKRLFRSRSVDDSAGAGHPQLLANDRHTVMVWKTFDGKSTRLQVIRSDDSGNSWSPAFSPMQTSGTSDHPMLVAYGDRIHVSWHTQQEGYRLMPVTTGGDAR
ncbi:MAG TPA: sialidase family protein [Gammaproteobacteria bacterium]|jgi:hypothetical protein